MDEIKMSVSDFLLKNESCFSKIIEKSFSVKEYMPVLANCIKKNPVLMQCSIESIKQALLRSAITKLMPYNDYAIIIPLWLKHEKCYEARFYELTRGLIKMYYDLGIVDNIYITEVRENDFFEYAIGTTNKLIHRPALSNRGKTMAYYCIAKNRNHEYINMLTYDDINRHYKCYSSDLFSALNESFDEIATRMILRKMFRYFPYDNNKFLVLDDQDEYLDRTYPPGFDVDRDIINRKIYQSLLLLDDLKSANKIDENDYYQILHDLNLLNENSEINGIYDIIDRLTNMNSVD